jgi:4-aminobutyrate aminotransferase
MVNSKEIMNKDMKYHIPGYNRTNILLVEGKGATLRDNEGNDYIDCFAGIAVTNVGHAPERLAKAAYDQMLKLNHTSGVFYTVPQSLLVEKLAEIAPGDLQRTYLCTSGTEAVENGVKIAKKYAVSRGKTGAGLISVELSFHGRYGHAMALTGQAKYKNGFSNYPYVPGVVHAPAPYPYRSTLEEDECGEQTALAVEEVIDRQTAGDIAAFVIEPVLGEGGIIVPPNTYYQTLTKILKEREIPFFVDEVQSGFARTGKMFASEYWDLKPDIMTTAKGMGSGVPIGAAIASDEVGTAIKSGDMFSTYSGNPICSAVALENIKMIEEMNLINNANKIGKIFMDGLQEIKSKRRLIGDVRGKGLMIGIELVKDQQKKTPAKTETVEVKNILQKDGVIIGYGGFYGNVLRLQPPLVISEEQAKTVLGKLDTVLANY